MATRRETQRGVDALLPLIARLLWVQAELAESGNSLQEAAITVHPAMLWDFWEHPCPLLLYIDIMAVKPESKSARKGAESKSSGLKARKAISRPSKRPRSSSSDVSSDDEHQGSTDQSAMLAMLLAHSRMMLGIDGPDEAESSTAAQRRNGSASDGIQSGSEVSSNEEEEDEDDEEDEEEYQSDDGWTGIAEPERMSAALSERDKLTFSCAKPTCPGRGGLQRSLSVRRHDRVDLQIGAPSVPRQSFIAAICLAHSQKSSSSKMMGIVNDYGPNRKRNQTRIGGDGDSASEGEDDLSNRALDKTLHSMLLTTLIPENTAHARPVEKRNAISARLAQLSSYSLPGEPGRSSGSASPALSAELSRHPAKIRTGIVHARAKREARAAEEERQASHVRGLKKGPKERSGTKRLSLGDAGKKKGMESRKEGRVRGLASGFGKFENGMLKLSEREIARGSGQGRERGPKPGKKRKH